MKEIIPTKKHLLVKRAKIMKFLKKEGYSGEDIATIFNIDRSGVSRILKAEEKYKGLVRKVLKN
jgi:DNA-binding MarR family transcriptional regulator